ncbi:MAG TPA: YibE/F family protein, partial [Patescibacteria group bacterium]|nr:YibE/F family protein [Patescibacteria group bacterium]
IIFAIGGSLIPSVVFAQQNTVKDEFFRARVIQASEDVVKKDDAHVSIIQKIRVRILSGSEKGNEYDITPNPEFTSTKKQNIEQGNVVVVAKTTLNSGEIRWDVIDQYRLPNMGWAFAIFIGLVIFFTRKRGVMSLVGLAVSVAILGFVVIPQILSGGNPLVWCLAGALIIAIVSLYLAHGFSTRTSIAVVGTLITVLLSVGVGALFVWLTRLSGAGNEDAFYLQLTQLGMSLDLRGLLLGAMIIGTLGVLDDVTTAQSAVVGELHLANPSFSRAELYARGLSVGREHITSLVNTLALAYIGASFPLFLYIPLNKSEQPVWLLFNSEFLAEEIIRTLVGSTVLVLAVPITTLIAATVFGKKTHHV